MSHNVCQSGFMYIATVTVLERFKQSFVLKVVTNSEQSMCVCVCIYISQPHARTPTSISLNNQSINIVWCILVCLIFIILSALICKINPPLYCTKYVCLHVYVYVYMYVLCMCIFVFIMLADVVNLKTIKNLKKAVCLIRLIYLIYIRTRAHRDSE